MTLEESTAVNIIGINSVHFIEYKLPKTIITEVSNINVFAFNGHLVVQSVPPLSLALTH